MFNGRRIKDLEDQMSALQDLPEIVGGLISEVRALRDPEPEPEPEQGDDLDQAIRRLQTLRDQRAEEATRVFEVLHEGEHRSGTVGHYAPKVVRFRVERGWIYIAHFSAPSFKDSVHMLYVAD